MDEMTLTLKSPITEEQWDMIVDVDFEHTESILFHTKHGKEVEFVKRKKGKWVPFEYGDDTWHKCTACGVADNYIDIVHRPNNSIGRLVSVRNFCPNCGAEMKGDSNC